MPDDHPALNHVSLRIPQDIVDAFDALARALERPRSWVMLRALRQYLDDEGAEILEDGESLAELDRGESAPFEDVLSEVEKIIAKAEARRAGRK